MKTNRFYNVNLHRAPFVIMFFLHSEKNIDRQVQHTVLHTMPVTTGEKCIVTTTTTNGSSSFHATFIDVYTGIAYINHSQTVHDFPAVPTTREAYLAKLQSTTRLLVGKKQYLISTKSIIQIESLESLVHDILTEAIPNVPIDCLQRVADYV